MAHDELGLGVGVRLLVKQLDGGHLPASLWDLDAVANEDESPAYAQSAQSRVIASSLMPELWKDFRSLT
jgi:hypothetical protein